MSIPYTRSSCLNRQNLIANKAFHDLLQELPTSTKIQHSLTYESQEAKFTIHFNTYQCRPTASKNEPHNTIWCNMLAFRTLNIRLGCTNHHKAPKSETFINPNSVNSESTKWYVDLSPQHLHLTQAVVARPSTLL